VTLLLDPARTALVIQDMQNDVLDERGGFGDSGAPQHARERDVVGNVRRLAAAFRAAGAPVVHVWQLVDEGAPGVKVNAPIFEGLAGGRGMVRGTWGGRPVAGLEPQPGDHVVEKMRMSAWEGTRLEVLLAGLGVGTLVLVGAWTNMSVEHTARTGADKGFTVVVAEDGCATMNADWHRASIAYALPLAATVSDCATVAAALA